MKYITYREVVNDNLEYFILQKDHPHFVGIISEIPTNKLVPSVPITGHSLYVNLYSTLRGMYLPSYKNIAEEIGTILNEMALFFYENRILANPKKYKKWKIQQSQ